MKEQQLKELMNSLQALCAEYEAEIQLLKKKIKATDKELDGLRDHIVKGFDDLFGKYDS